MDRDTGRYRWIDFDFNYLHKENMFGYDLFGLGNILVYLTGRGDITIQDLKKERPQVFNSITDQDMNIIFHNRLVNLQKVFPYIPKALNLILLHFSSGANIFYDTAAQMIADLHEAKEDLIKLTGRGNECED
jgi:hypothetical protein